MIEAPDNFYIFDSFEKEKERRERRMERLESEENEDDEENDIMNEMAERYCSISESIIESCKEVKLMREGKLPKKTWKELKLVLEENKDDEEEE